MFLPMQNYVLFGSPGSGKGTQCANLVRELGFLHLSTGDMLREERALNSDLGRLVQDLMDAGQLVSDDIVMQILEVRLKQHEDRGLLFDGIPRTKAQAKMLDELLSSYGFKLDKILVLNVPDEILLDRLKARAKVDHRTDDREAIILRRISEYHQYVIKTLEYYKPQQIVQIDGVGNVEEVFTRIKQHIS